MTWKGKGSMARYLDLAAIELETAPSRHPNVGEGVPYMLYMLYMARYPDFIDGPRSRPVPVAISASPSPSPSPSPSLPPPYPSPPPANTAPRCQWPARRVSARGVGRGASGVTGACARGTRMLPPPLMSLGSSREREHAHKGRRR